MNIDPCSYQNMLPNEEPAVGEARLRDRSYSDAHHALMDSNDVPDIAVDKADATMKKVGAPNSSSSHKMSCSKKHHQHGNRPRSKSCDLHHRRAHSTPVVQKKKYPHHHRHHSPRAHSPHGHGRLSPGQLKGKMWIRPAAVFTSPMPTFPTLSKTSGPSTEDKHDQQKTDGGFTFTDLVAPLNSNPPPRLVTNTGSASPSPTPLDDEMLMYASPNSFDDDKFRRHQSEPARVIFGESGKPIGKPRTAFEFEQYAPAAAVL